MSANPSAIRKIKEEAQALSPQLSQWRRDFHRHPELAFQERRSAGVIAEHLRNWGFQVREGVAQTGVVGVLRGAGPGPVVMLRFDMDALPLEEVPDREYRSQVPGVMHACGHDGHMAVGLGVARLMSALPGALPGTLMLVFQPAEEGMDGAQRMLEDGLFHELTPDVALGMHVWNEKEVGVVGLGAGPVMAGAEELRMRVEGRGGHGAVPHETLDPVPVAAELVLAIQGVVSRSVDPLKAAVISITQLRAGEAFNVIPETVHLVGTVRTFEPQVREKVLARIEQLAAGLGQAHGCSIDVQVKQVAPPLVNDEGVYEKLVELLAQEFPSLIHHADQRWMGSEDMAYFLQRVPGCYLFFGSADAQRGLDAPHHNPAFDFDERVLPLATAVMAAAAWRLMESER